MGTVRIFFARLWSHNVTTCLNFPTALSWGRDSHFQEHQTHPEFFFSYWLELDLMLIPGVEWRHW